MSTPPLNPLVDKIRAMHPGAYDDMDDAALTKAVLRKYPQYSDLAAPAVQKPNVQMESQGPIGSAATSFTTRMADMPKDLWRASFFGELGNPEVKAQHERQIAAMEAPGMEGVKNTFGAVNPVARNIPGNPNSPVDWGSTAANLVPLLLSAKGLRTPEIDTSDALTAAKAVGKLAVKDAASHVPIAGRLVQRPSIMDYVRAARTQAPQQAPAVYPGAPNPTATPEQFNPALVSQSRTLPGMNSPEVIRPPAQPIPQRSGLMLPGKTEPVEIPPSKVSTTPPTKSARLSQARSIPAVQDKSTILPRLRALAQKIEAEGSTPESADLTPKLQESLKALPQTRVQGKIMQVLRKEGPGLSVGIDRLSEAPELKGVSRQQILDAATSLRDQGKIWHEQTGGGAHPVSYTMALKGR